jgi:serine/threonine protein kinase/formylglycine-generating enzyme required for sulfatase activity/Leucine-rich repeat (LRR) protein
MSDETIFAAALELPAADRAAYLATACGSDAARRRRVEGLLTASDRAGAFMARPAVEEGTELVDPSSTPNDVTVTRAGPDQPAADDAEVPLGFLQPATRPDSLGRIGHYEVLQVLGQGGFGIVFRAFDDVLQRVVAVKVLAPQLAATSPARKRFLREARSSAQVRHENVVQVYEVGETPLPYIAMEFIPGETLQQRLNRIGPVDPAEVVRVGRQVAEGLAAAHATDLIHRDIKPGNVLLESGPQHRAKITDFGLARAADDASISQSGIIAGTPMYMAPEQALGHKLDQRADLFSLGSMLYQMVAGRAPFRANSTVAVLKRVAEDTPRDIREIIPETPKWLCDIIAKLHAKNPDDRYQSAREIADVLADCEQQLKTHGTLKDYSRIPGGNPQPRRTGRKWKRAAAAVVLLLAVTVGSYAGPFTLRYMSDAGKVTFLNADYPEDKLLVRRDGQVVATLDSTNSSAHLDSGEYELEAVCAEGEEVSSVIAGTRRLFEGTPGRGADGPVLKLTIRRGDRIRVGFGVKDKVPPPSLPDAWVPLFNGKDLSGWKTHPAEPGNWRVENGSIVGRAPTAFLFSERGDYENFQLRAEVKFTRRMDSGLLFRCEYRPGCGGYEANINEDAGRLIRHHGERLRTFDIAPGVTSPATNTWYTQEVIANGEQLEVKVNGQTVIKVTDDAFTRGHLALQVFQPSPVEGTAVHFRKIEIKELPSGAAPPTFKNGIGMEFVKVPKGKSWLGGGKDKLGDQEVVIPADFYLGKYEVTQEEWEKVMGENPSHFSRAGGGKDAVKDVPDADLKRFPVDRVSWDQCQVFLAKLNEREKETGWVYRLPKLTEWEYACRGGPMADKADSAFDFYLPKPTNALLPVDANFGKRMDRTCKVGSYQPNRLGLFDLHGNVQEWCEDSKQATTDDGKRLRGGSFRIGQCEAKGVAGAPSTFRGDDLGLRLARVPSGPPSPVAKTPPAAVAPFTDADVKRIAALPAAEQVEEVRKELMRRNPGFDGTVGHKIEDGVVTEFRVVTDNVTDIAPIRVFNALRVLDCSGTQTRTWEPNGVLADLSPLAGMNLAGLTHLGVGNTPVGDAGLAYFKGCKGLRHLELTKTRVGDEGLAHFTHASGITHLGLGRTRVTDTGLAHFKDCKDLTSLDLHGTKVSDAGLAVFKDCVKLKRLDLQYTEVGDAGLAHLKDCTGLTDLGLWRTKVTDGGMSHLKGCHDLTSLGLTDTAVGDAGLAHVKGYKNLRGLSIGGTNVTDAGLAHLKDCKNLGTLRLVGTQVTDAGLADLAGLRQLTELDLTRTKVTPSGVEGLAKALPKCKITWDGGVVEPTVAVGPFTDADVRRIAALPAAEQVEEVRKELKKRNPGFDGEVGHKIEGGVVTEFRIVTDQVTDIAPIRVFSALRVLDCSGTWTNKSNGLLAGLTPLKAMNLAGLTHLNLSNTRVGDAGLEHFAGCKNLTGLWLSHTSVSNAGMARFKDCKGLEKLNLKYTRVDDAGLSYFQGCNELSGIDLGGLEVTDAGLAYFKDCTKLTGLWLNSMKVTDAGLAHFKNCTSLIHLQLTNTQVTDAGLAWIKDCKHLTGLWLNGTKVTDLSLLKGMPLKELACDFQPERDAEILRPIKTLEKINGKPVAEFWKDVEEK